MKSDKDHFPASEIAAKFAETLKQIESNNPDRKTATADAINIIASALTHQKFHV